MSIDVFLDKKADTITDDVQQQMRAVDREAREKYEAKLTQAYYSSSDFWGSAIAAAGARGTSSIFYRYSSALVFTSIVIK